MKLLQHVSVFLFLLVASCSENNPSGDATQGESAPGEEEFEFQVKYGLLNRDPVENDPKYREIFKRIDAEVDELLADHPHKGSLGFVHVVWHTKQERLKETYGIDWKSPAELNPSVLFD